MEFRNGGLKSSLNQTGLAKFRRGRFIAYSIAYLHGSSRIQRLDEARFMNWQSSKHALQKQWNVLSIILLGVVARYSIITLLHCLLSEEIEDIYL